MSDRRSAAELLARSAIVLWECVREAVAQLLQHPQRSALSALGIAVGVAAVLAIGTLSEGLTGAVTAQFVSMGGATLVVHSEQPPQEADRRRQPLVLADVEQLRRGLLGAGSVTPMLEVLAAGALAPSYGKTVATGRLIGTTEGFHEAQQSYPRLGRVLSHSDDQLRRRVVVLGDKMRRLLGLPANPVGSFVSIGREWFRVVGVMEPRGEMLGISQDEYLVVPFNTALALAGIAGPPEISIYVTVRHVEEMSVVRQRIVSLLRQRRGLASARPADFSIESSSQLRRSFDEVSLAVTAVATCVVGISLLVGGIGLMNVMLISVTERTREIGLAKALGATDRAILARFLAEAVVLSVAGGLVGVTAGWGIATAIGDAIGLASTLLSGWLIAGTVAFTTFVGILSGLVPARRAASMQPVDALRAA